jgi:drug/metabolite transporter (DMT)-like permease
LERIQSLQLAVCYKSDIFTVMTSSEKTATTKACGLTEILLFVAAIVSGTACSICSKTMMDLKGIGMAGDVESFSKPIFQTFGMFVGMMFGLVLHMIVVFFRIPFPGYTHAVTITTTSKPSYPIATERDSLLASSKATTPTSNTNSSQLPGWMYLLLALPSVFDLGATVLCMMGLRYLDVSIYQLLRGSGIVFVALMKHYALKDRLYSFQWIGVGWNVVSVILVGLTAILASSSSSSSSSTPSSTDVLLETEATSDASFVMLGILLVLSGALIQALQFVFEEKVMTMDIPAPPLLLIGMEGLWGTVLCLTVVYPLAYIIPGDDHGSYEHFGNTWHMITHTPTIQYMFAVYFFAIFGYNILAVLVTFLLNSIWHAILDNFRPITVWLVDMLLFYVFTSGSFGEAWTSWSFLQLAGLSVLLYGTAIYNAPHAGSIKLRGEWYSFGWDSSSEYAALEQELNDAELDAAFENRKLINKRTNSSFIGGRSPFLGSGKKL